MSMVLWVFFRATGQDAQRVVDRGISSNSFLLDPPQAAIRQVDALQPAVNQFVQLAGRKAWCPVFRVYFSNASRRSNQQRHGYLLSFLQNNPQKTVFWGMSFNRRGVLSGRRAGSYRSVS